MGKLEGQIARGKKWAEKLAFLEFKENKKSIAWLKSQKNIMDEIEIYRKDLAKKEAEAKAKAAAEEKEAARLKKIQEKEAAEEEKTKSQGNK